MANVKQKHIRLGSKCLILVFVLRNLSSLEGMMRSRRATVKNDSIDHYKNTIQQHEKNVPIENITCESQDIGPCCAPWDLNTDKWWTHHPDWEISSENETNFCFSPIKQKNQAEFNLRVYDLQWNGDCSNVLQEVQINAEFDSNLDHIASALLYATDRNLPFQITKHFPDDRWHYSAKDSSSWEYCNSTDMNCFFLPLSKCKPIIGKSTSYNLRRMSMPGRSEDLNLAFNYITRQRQIVRRRIFDITQEHEASVDFPCTAIHIPHLKDSAYGIRQNFNAAALEYMKVGNFSEGENIVLLSNDQRTIKELLRSYPNFKWIYLNRTQYRGVEREFDGHIPSEDNATEFLFMMAQLKLAKKCVKLVHVQSDFIQISRKEFMNLEKPQNIFHVGFGVTSEDDVPQASQVEKIWLKLRQQEEAKSITGEKATNILKDPQNTTHETEDLETDEWWNAFYPDWKLGNKFAEKSLFYSRVLMMIALIFFNI